MTPADAETSGTGGGLRYLTEEACPDVVAQEQSHSCQVACARQLLIDAGVFVSEVELLAQTEYYEGSGTDATDVARTLTALHPDFEYAGGGSFLKYFATFMTIAPWIASLQTDSGSIHAVIVDRSVGDVVHIRDPWGASGPGSEFGCRATMALKDFKRYWRRAYYVVIYRKRPRQETQP